MTEYQPLRLRNARIDGVACKVGDLVRTDLGRIEVTVRLNQRGDYVVVANAVDAGTVYTMGPGGQWGIASHEADGTPSAWMKRHSPTGYRHQSTLREAVERVVNEWATNLWYAQQKTAGQA